MPRFETAESFPFPPARVFALLRRPAERLTLAPPELRLRLIDGPEELTLGSRITVEGRRWGLTRRVVSEVTAFEADALLVEEQREGPFRSWVHRQRLGPLPTGGCHLADVIDYEPPGGVLGQLLQPGAVQRELDGVFAFRNRKLAELLGAAGS